MANTETRKQKAEEAVADLILMAGVDRQHGRAAEAERKEDMAHNLGEYIRILENGLKNFSGSTGNGE